MAEALLKQQCGELFEVKSAGMNPGTLNPLAVEVMGELGIDISQNETKDLFPFIRERPGFDYVISLCDVSQGQQCPTFPGGTRQLEWSFPDPSKLTGSHEEKLAQVREIRDAINTRIATWCAEICVTLSNTM